MAKNNLNDSWKLNPLKILQINNHYSRVGGAEVVFMNTIDLLRKKNQRVISFSRNEEVNEPTFQDNYFINYSKSFLKRFYSYDAANLIEQIIIKEKPDIAHVHNIVGGITFSILSVLKRYKIPIVASIHDFRLLCPVCHFIDGKNQVCQKCQGGKYYHCTINNCSRNGIIKSFSLTIESYLRDILFPFDRFVDQYIFVSNFAKEKFLEVHPQILPKCTQIYNFTNGFHKKVEKGNYYLSFGRLANEKGLLTLLKAFNENPQAQLKIAGSGPMRKLLENSITANIELLGYKTGQELEELIQNASFVIVPSECYETNSLTTVESYAMGKPVIGSRIGALEELIKEGKTGFTFQPKDYKALSKLVYECSKIREGEYSKLSETAYSFALNSFSPEVHYSQLLNVYMKFLKN